MNMRAEERAHLSIFNQQDEDNNLSKGAFIYKSK